MYWLTPVTGYDPTVLGKDRKALDSSLADTLRKNMNQLHPRLLPFVKASVLPGSEEDCGWDDLLDLEEEGEMTFDGQSLTISHCGEHFFHSLLTPEKSLNVLQTQGNSLLFTKEEKTLIQEIVSYWKNGIPVVLIRQ